MLAMHIAVFSKASHQNRHVLSQMTGERVYLDVVHPVQQGDLMAGGLYLASNALVLCEQRRVALHVWRRVGQLRDLQSAQRLSQGALGICCRLSVLPSTGQVGCMC